MLLEVKNLTVNYGAVQALNQVSFCVNEGEIVSMIGPNGTGKSTALKAICGLLKVAIGEIKSGDIIFQKKSIKNIPTYELVKKGISLVPEDRRIFPNLTVIENLEIGAFTIDKKEVVKERLRRVFILFPKLKERYKQKACTLSSGEQQMLAIGRALMLKPILLLIDEPSLGLSPNYVEAVFYKIKEINKEGISILLVEQNVRTALEFTDRAYIFKIGEIAFEDMSKNLLRNDEVRKSFLGE